MKYYFCESLGEENCFTLDAIKDMMRFEGVNEVTVFEAKIEYGSGFFYCSEHGFCGESGEGCGNECKEYKPRNGKSGRCKSHKNCYEPIGEEIIIKINP